MIPEGNALKQGGLISIIPPTFQETWAENLTLFVADFKPAALILDPPFHNAVSVVSAANRAELAVLLLDNIQHCKDVGATGVYVTGNESDVLKARSLLGSEAIIGAACGLSRHDAMEKAEAGADFIAFTFFDPQDLHRTLDLSQWWTEIFEVACGVCGPSSLLTLDFIQQGRFDFVLLREVTKPAESLTFATEFGLVSQS